MKTKYEDKRFDKLLKELFSVAAADESTIDEVVASPSVWWGIQRQVREEQQKKQDISFSKIWRWLLIGVPTAAAAVLLVALFISGSSVPPSSMPVTEQAVLVETEPPASSGSFPKEIESRAIVKAVEKQPKRSVRPVLSNMKLAKTFLKLKTTVASTADTDIKSEFIALSYARDPESGQIVRVKVPRSMMVTVGLLASVDKPSTLVDAEVLVGDDGLTRAIRFIR